MSLSWWLYFLGGVCLGLLFTHCLKRRDYVGLIVTILAMIFLVAAGYV